MPKPWWKSKVIWVNILGAVVVLVQYLSDSGLAGIEITGAVLAMVNIVLRLITSQPIGTPEKPTNTTTPP